MQKATSDHQFHQRLENVPNFYYLDDKGAMIWLIVGSQKALVIDSGYGNIDIPTAARRITQKPLIFVNTHVHHDHAKGDYQFDTVYVHQDDIFLFEKTKKRLKDAFKLPKNIIPIQDGHIFDLGDIQIKAVHLPGHTPGSIGLCYPQASAIICGDAIMPEHWNHLGHSTSLEVFVNSMKRLNALESDYDILLMSHGKTGLALKFDLSKKLQTIAEKIISGELIGEPTQDVYGQPAHFVVYQGTKMLYNPNRLTGQRK